MKKITLLIFLITGSIIIAQQPFDCNEGNFYQVISGVMKAYDPITGSYSEALHSYSAYNAGGYNIEDNYLYAIKNSDRHLLRIAKDMVIDLGEVTINGTTEFGGGYAADIDDQGNLWVFQNTDKISFHKITNLTTYDGTSSPTFEIVQADVASPSNCADIAFVNGSFYGGSKGKLFTWDLSSGTPVFSSKTVANLPNSTFGAAYADATNRLYLSDNKGGLYLINDYTEASPTAVLLNLTETTNSNDGFKCASGISPLDRDQDGILDSMDADCDGDGITNTAESKGIDPYGDQDGDNMYNYLDNDFSGNGNNVVQDAFDRDGDGNPDFLDIDSDNDGIYDIVEAGHGDKDTNNDGVYNGFDAGYIDSDNDGVADFFDTDHATTDFTPLDTDNDTIYDCYDTDSDNDGIVDIIEGQNPGSYTGLSGIDQDKDGMDDAFDPDFGNTTNGTVNTDNQDDGYDHLDIDSDNDGILDNTIAYDYDGDGIAETTPSGIDNDEDGLDDNYDLRKSSFDPENGNQTPSSFPVPEICDRYNYLGDFTSDGTPLYFDEKDTVSQETIDMINNALPEGYPVPDYNPHYISSGYDTDVILEEQADIWITFVGEGAGYKNTLGFYTYDKDAPSVTAPTPEDITIVFPNVSAVGSGGSLEVGDKVKIGTFSANTGIGWVLLANAWSDGCVGTGHWQVHSNPDYNPESNASLRYHNVLLSDPDNERIILGFEDIRRDYASCDQDFNDALFYITASPYTAIKTTNYVGIETATPVTSGNNGGLESNGDLANLIAKRNFIRTKTNAVFNTKKTQKSFQPGIKSYKSSNNEDLSVHFPKTGMLGTETTYVSSPEDLLGITNAQSVFSVDYYDGEERVAAALATSTKGTIYDHSKTICDRLNGSTLLDVRTVNIKNHTLVSTRIMRATGEIEYTLTFSIKKEDAENEVYSLWNINEYPAGDYINFQVWGGSVSQVSNIANHILDSFLANKPIRSHKVSNSIPTVFVQKGFYANGKLTLDIINKLGATHMIFNGNIRKTEQTSETNINKTIALSGAYSEQISIDTGHLFDIGFSIAGEHSTKLDALYLADGPWGIDYLQQGVVIDSFEVIEHHKKASDHEYTIERNAIVQGEVKETINLFRNILAGDLTFDVSNFDAVQFEMTSNTDIELILVTEGLTDWNNRLRYTITATDENTMHTISFADFTNNNNKSEEINRVRGIVFSVQGDYQTFIPFYLSVSDLAFTNTTKDTPAPESVEELEESEVAEIIEEETVQIIEEVSKPIRLMNYPNPFTTTTTIQLPDTTNETLEIMVIDMVGRTVRHEQVASKTTALTFKTRNLTPGMYQYIIKDINNKQYIGNLLIQ
ncbi:DUF6923 family protein [Aquimarina pacifica]|uniref:DUF6923 family protein n=1 Tax=Aquimarina pacifica TaxID=1296415 RepID=UPI000472A300|nr:DUF4114 domain-containing protein [Aquimarina pacifica]